VKKLGWANWRSLIAAALIMDEMAALYDFLGKGSQQDFAIRSAGSDVDQLGSKVQVVDVAVAQKPIEALTARCRDWSAATSTG
jgi:hypothetical protein